MIMLVNCEWRQKDLIEKIEEVEMDGNKIFKFIKKDGMRMYFNTRLPNIEKSVLIAYMLISEAIYKIPGALALAISIVPVVNGSVFEGYKYTCCKSNTTGDSPKLLQAPKFDTYLE